MNTNEFTLEDIKNAVAKLERENIPDPYRFTVSAGSKSKLEKLVEWAKRDGFAVEQETPPPIVLRENERWFATVAGVDLTIMLSPYRCTGSPFPCGVCRECWP